MTHSQYYRTTHAYGDPPAKGDPNMAAAWGIAQPPVQDPPMLAYRGASLSQPFDMRARIKCSRLDNKPLIGCWLGGFPNAHVARAVAQVGYDFVLLDWEHTPMSISEVCELIKWINYAGEGSTAAVVRVPNGDHAYVAWLLDAGASAIILPHTETVEDAQAFVKAARHPKYGGNRSGPPNALYFGVNDAPNALEVWSRAAVICQIESKKGADNASAIAGVEGVDGLMLGPGDLAFDLGLSFAEMASSDEWKG